MDKDRSDRKGRLIGRACLLMAVLWLIGAVTAAVSPHTALAAAAGGIGFLGLLLFVVLHAARSYGWRGLAAFLAISIAVSFAFEASSIATGFPFGFYTHHTPGPRPLGVPLPVPLGYAVYGWFAWVLACMIIRDDPAKAAGFDRFSTPIVATFVLAGYDYPFDPIGAAVAHTHTYRAPSGLMGVPLVNFLGWLLTGWVTFQVFAILERRFRPNLSVGHTFHWLVPSLIWGLMPVSYFIQFARAPAGAVTVGTRSFVIADVYEAAAALSLIAMIFPAITAVLRLCGKRMAAQSPADRAAAR